MPHVAGQEDALDGDVLEDVFGLPAEHPEGAELLRVVPEPVQLEHLAEFRPAVDQPLDALRGGLQLACEDGRVGVLAAAEPGADDGVVGLRRLGAVHRLVDQAAAELLGLGELLEVVPVDGVADLLGEAFGLEPGAAVELPLRGRRRVR